MITLDICSFYDNAGRELFQMALMELTYLL